MQDKFNVKENNNDSIKVNTKLESSDDTNNLPNSPPPDSDKNRNCYDSNNTSGLCTSVISPGIDIGWIWRDINESSSIIMDLIRGKLFNSSESSYKKDRTGENLSRLIDLQEKQQKLQKFIFSSTVTLLFLICCYKMLTHQDETLGYYGITNKCFFIKDLLENGGFNNTSKKYELLYISIIFAFSIILSIVIKVVEMVKKMVQQKRDDNNPINNDDGKPVEEEEKDKDENKKTDKVILSTLTAFLTLIIIGWVLLGNGLFTKECTIMLIILYFSTMFVTMLILSNMHYIKIKKLQKKPIDEKTTKKNGLFIRLIVAVIVLFNIFIVCKTLYNVFRLKDPSLEYINTSIQKLKGTDKLTFTKYIEDTVFLDLKGELNVLIRKLPIIKKDYMNHSASLVQRIEECQKWIKNNIKTTPKKLTMQTNLKILKLQRISMNTHYERFIKSIITKIISKDTWFKDVCENYKLKAVNLNIIIGDLTNLETKESWIAEFITTLYKDKCTLSAPWYNTSFKKMQSRLPKDEQWKVDETDIDTIKKNLFSTIGQFTCSGESAYKFKMERVILDCILGVPFRLIEICNIVVINPIHVIINIFKTIFHLIIHDPNSKELPQNLNDMNLINYWNYDKLNMNIFDRLSKRLASMYELYILNNITIEKV